MQQREQFPSAWLSHEVSRTTLCQLFGISRQTGYKWVKRYKQDGSVEGAFPSTQDQPSYDPSYPRELILSQRRQFPRWGPLPIRKRLTMHWAQREWPAASTIGAILKRHGMVPARVCAERMRQVHRGTFGELSVDLGMLRNPERAWYREGAAKTIDRADVERRIGPRPEPIEALAGGLANINVRVGRDRVLRVGDPSGLAKAASLLRRPWRALRTPRVLATGDDLLLLEFLELRPLPATAGEAVGRALAEIHALTYPKTGFVGADVSLAKLSRRRATWASLRAATATRC